MGSIESLALLRLRFLLICCHHLHESLAIVQIVDNLKPAPVNKHAIKLLSPTGISSHFQSQHPQRTEGMSIVPHMNDLMIRNIEYEMVAKLQLER